MKQKTLAARPWTGVEFQQSTHTVQEIHITDMEKLKGLFLRVANKFAKGCINGSDLFMKTENERQLQTACGCWW